VLSWQTRAFRLLTGDGDWASEIEYVGVVHYKSKVTTLGLTAVDAKLVKQLTLPRDEFNHPLYSEQVQPVFRIRHAFSAK
jgi:hypothetical protein